jgi:WD40 repeat protein/serine/threonine protein kinase
MAGREGQQFGNYRLTRLLGKGAFAEVYLAEQVYLGTQAAIKVLHTQLATAEEAEKFRLEARTIATLVHPNIVRVLDFGVQGNTPYLLMDYAPNGSLRQKFPAQPLAPAVVLPYLKQMAEALHYAHDQRLVHRDVKPENMLLGRNNEGLLSDFGIALVAQSTNMQQTQGIAGTAAYMAPEQFQGKPRPASDQYSLGIVAYEWLTGERPFNGTFTEVAGQHMVATPPPLRQKVPSLSPELERVVLTALAKEPKDRFATIRAFGNALEQAINGGLSYATNLQAPINPAGPGVPGLQQPSIYGAETVISAPPTIPVPPPNTPANTNIQGGGPTAFSPSGPPPYAPAGNAGWAANTPSSPPPYADTFMTGLQTPAAPRPPVPAQTPPRQGVSRRNVIIAGAAGLALVGGGSAAAYLLLNNKPGTTTSNGPGSNATPSPTGAANATTTPTEATTPTETATAGPPQPGDILFNFIGHTGEVSCLAWHPNAKFLVSGSFDHTARVWNLSTNKLIFTYSKHTDQIWAVAWSPNDKLIATGGRDRTVQVWDTLSGTQPKSLYSAHSDAISGLAWSPDSSLIASASYDMTVRVWEALTQQFHYTFDGHTDRVWAVAWSPNGNGIASGSRDKTVWVWRPDGTGTIYTYMGHSDGVSAVAWSPNNKRIASGSYDRTVQVWDAGTGDNVITYTGHSANVTSVDWSPDGQYIVSASQDGKVHVWRASSGQQVLVYSKHTGAVDGVAWGPGGQRIASASADKSVQVWLAPD